MAKVAQPGEIRTCEASHVQNMNMNKEVATRLFRMLAVSEQTANTLKRDGASYAKLNLLTQQMNLLQAQAHTTVEKSVTKAQAVDGDITVHAQSTALSAEFDEGAKRMLMVMAVDDKTVATIKRDAPASAKLSLLSEQAAMLQQQAQETLSEAEVNTHLFEVASRITCKLVPGTMYYHYTQQGSETISRIANNDWDNYEEFHGKYLYDWDHTFRRQPLVYDGPQHATPGFTPMLMLPNIGATPATPINLSLDGAEPAAKKVKKPEITGHVHNRFQSATPGRA